MLNPKGDTAVYLLYSYARICSVLRKGIAEGNLTQSDLENFNNFEFTDPSEK